MKKRLIFFLATLLFVLILIGCTGKKPSFIIGLEWNQDKKIVQQQVEKIPAGVQVYGKFENKLPLNSTNIQLRITKGESIVSGGSALAKPEDTSIIIPFQIGSPGKYQLEIFADEKKLFEQDVTAE